MAGGAVVVPQQVTEYDHAEICPTLSKPDTDLIVVLQGASNTTGNWFTVPTRFLDAVVVDWVKPHVLTLHEDGPLEVKVNFNLRLVLHSLGAVFWTPADFVGKRRVEIRDLLEYSHLPRGKYLILPVGPVGQDLVTHYLCPCGAYLAPGSKQ